MARKKVEVDVPKKVTSTIKKKDISPPKKRAAKKKVASRQFTLLVDPLNLLLKHYGETYDEKVDEVEEIPISDVKPKKTKNYEKNKAQKRVIYFIDPLKCKNKYYLNMIDIQQGGCLPITTTKPCWGNCRSTFKTRPMGCPLKYNMTPTDKEMKELLVNRLKQLNLPHSDKDLDFFETEGNFCSLPCIKAYICSNISMGYKKYKSCFSLLSLMCLKLNGSIYDIPVAHTWKTLTDFQGWQSVAEYRSSTGNMEYTDNGDIRRPYMFCTATYIQEKQLKT